MCLPYSLLCNVQYMHLSSLSGCLMNLLDKLQSTTSPNHLSVSKVSALDMKGASKIGRIPSKGMYIEAQRTIQVSSVSPKSSYLWQLRISIIAFSKFNFRPKATSHGPIASSESGINYEKTKTKWFQFQLFELGAMLMMRISHPTQAIRLHGNMHIWVG